MKGVLKAKIRRKNAKPERMMVILGLAGGMCGVLGREKERGQKPLEIGDIGRSLQEAAWRKQTLPRT